MFAVIDIEADGGPYGKEKIIEIAILQFDGEKITDRFSALVNPDGEISHYVQKLTGITNKAVRTAPKFHEIAKRIVEITEDCTLVGHNVDFDYRMLKQAFAELSYPYRRETIDTLPLAEKMIPDMASYGLAKLSAALGIPHTDIHRAMGDARATLDLFRLLLSKDNAGEIIRHQQIASYQKTLRSKLYKLIRPLPAQKGIVYLKKEKGKDDVFYASHMRAQTEKKLFKILAADPSEAEAVKDIVFEKTSSALCSMLVCLSKEVRYTATFRYGLYYKENEWRYAALSADIEPLLQFTTGSQARKIVAFLRKENILNPEQLAEKFPADSLHACYTGQGRNREEKLFLILNGTIPESYGFYTLYHQIKDLEKRDSRAIPLPHAVPDFLINEIKLQLLTGNLKLNSTL